MTQPESDARYSGAARWRAYLGRRRRLEELSTTVRDPHPAPIVSMRDVAGEHEMPGPRLRPNAVTLAQEATEHGWRGRATYAYGTAITAKGEPDGLVESVALRMERGTEHAVALWYRRDGRWAPEDAWYWRDGEIPRRMGVTNMRKMVKTDILSPPACTGSAQTSWAGQCLPCASGTRHCFHCVCCKGF